MVRVLGQDLGRTQRAVADPAGELAVAAVSRQSARFRGKRRICPYHRTCTGTRARKQRRHSQRNLAGPGARQRCFYRHL